MLVSIGFILGRKGGSSPVRVEQVKEVEERLYDLSFVKSKLSVGMTREQVFDSVGLPNKETGRSIYYFEWNPARLENLNKKGVYGVVVRFKNSKVESWGEEAQFY